MSNPTWDALLKNCFDDPSLAAELAESFLATAPTLLQNISQAAADTDAAALATEAHGLKGVCLTMGFESLAEIARRLETAGKTYDLSTAIQDIDELRTNLIETERKLAAVLESQAPASAAT